MNFYHRLLRLRHYRPGPVATVVLFEGSIIVSIVLALAEILDWWGVLAVPIAVAAAVKLNDIVAGLAIHTPRHAQARGVARVRKRWRIPVRRRPLSGTHTASTNQAASSR